jgi:hypothetical protein
MRPCSSRFSSASRWKCARKVETSTVSWPKSTCTIWKRRPMIRERRKTPRTCSGVAFVGDVEVLRPHADEEVAHRPADDEREVARALQLFARAPGPAADRSLSIPCLSLG